MISRYTLVEIVKDNITEYQIVFDPTKEVEFSSNDYAVADAKYNQLIEADFLKSVSFVSAYIVERCYGGAEEGGWYYNKYIPIASIPVDESNYLTAMDFLNTHIKNMNLYLGEKIYITEEREQYENQTKGRPYYE